MLKISFQSVLAVASLATVVAAAPQTARKSTVAPAPAKKSTVKVTSSTTSRPTAARGTAARPATQRTAGRTKGKSAVAQVPARQAQPSSVRYREIQDALATKGYLKTPPTGVWDQDSIDAMRRFQEDQKLEPTGKLTSRALISLGLGPTGQSPQPPASPLPSPAQPPK